MKSLSPQKGVAEHLTGIELKAEVETKSLAPPSGCVKFGILTGGRRPWFPRRHSGYTLAILRIEEPQ